jgi:selenoprotein W-related protein
VGVLLTSVSHDFLDEVGPDHQHEVQRTFRIRVNAHPRARLTSPNGQSHRLCDTRHVPSPRLEITYCTQCRWLLRAGWTAQELLTTFPADIGEVALVPGTGGVFQVRLDDEMLWDRAAEGGFPELSRLKQLVRDRVAPGRGLGHSDRR